MAKMIKKAQNGAKTKAKPVLTPRVRQIADSLDNVASQKMQASINRTTRPGGSYDKISDELNRQAGKDSRNADRYRKIADAAEKKKKMKNGGSLTGLKASNKRVGPVDPKGAWTKVQEKTLKGAKGKAKLTADKQLGATKMKAGGKMSKGKKC
jgi:hypothetical protein